jgi:hypothetical protein
VRFFAAVAQANVEPAQQGFEGIAQRVVAGGTSDAPGLNGVFQIGAAPAANTVGDFGLGYGSGGRGTLFAARGRDAGQFKAGRGFVLQAVHAIRAQLQVRNLTAHYFGVPHCGGTFMAFLAQHHLLPHAKYTIMRFGDAYCTGPRGDPKHL